MPTQIDNSINSRDVQMELNDLAGKDWQLWSIGLLVLVVLATGFATLWLPPMMADHTRTAAGQWNFLPQLVSGLIVLVALLNIYLISQKKRLDKVRDGLIRNVLIRAEAETSPIVDRLTKVFAPTYVDVALEREVARADRNQSALTVAIFDVAGTSTINRDHGILAGDYLLLATGQLLKKTFRGGDIVCRYGGDQFVVVLPDTTAAQAEYAFNRVRDALARWNDNSELSYKLGLHLGTSTYVCGIPVETVIMAAKNSLQLDKKASPVTRLCSRPKQNVSRTDQSLTAAYIAPPLPQRHSTVN